MESNPKTIHFIGICGVAMSALAIALHKKGYTVTGSDKGFYPPVSTHLKDAGVNYYPGWHPEKMGSPDLVVVGNVAGSKNPEWLTVQEQKIPYVSYPELVAKHLVKERSVVCAGTYGKTTSACLLSWILSEADMDPSYMFGGISLNDLDSAAVTDSDISVLEGDEYKTSRWDSSPKFAHYSPTHLLLTSVVWDHADVYPTEQQYVDAFEKLVNGLPDSGLLVVSEKAKPSIQILNSKFQILSYGQSEGNDYQYTNVQTTKDGITFDIHHDGKVYSIESSTLGDYMADNMTGCFAMAHQLGIDPDNIISALKSFRSVKRRLEKRLDGSVTVFDDIAHSPSKAAAVLKSIRGLYDGKIVAVFEPNTGNRTQESFPGYANAFADATEVIIPRLTRVKVKAGETDGPCDGATLAKVIAQTHDHVSYLDDDDALVQYIKSNVTDGDVVIFLGSHGFRGMIDQTVDLL